MDDAKKIKILFVSHENDPGGIGGATKSLVSMIQGFEENCNIDIKVLLPYKRNGSVRKLLTVHSIPFLEMLFRHDVKPLKKKYNLKYLIFDILNYIAVLGTVIYIRKEKIDIVCSNTTVVDIGSKAAALLKIPHIYYAREMVEEGLGIEYRNKKQMTNLFQKSDAVICISQTVERYYKAVYHLQNTCWFYNGFLLDDYLIEDHMILSDDVLSIIQVGRFEDEKGTLKTIEMLHCLNQAGIRKWKMEFVGGGSKEYILKMENLMKRFALQSQIIVENYCTDIKKKLSSKDIVVINSSAEGFGRTVIEGMLAGCLVIGKNTGGVAEIIKNDENGLLFSRTEEFPILIKQIINERKKYKDMAKNGQKYALNFSNDICAKKFHNLVMECMEDKREKM